MTMSPKRNALPHNLLILICLLLASTAAWAADGDLDGVDDAVDNCPGVYNPTQADTDMDQIGDLCDPDADPDADGLPNDMDNCPNVSNPSQVDDDADGAGNTCDNCPNIPNVDQADLDHNGVGDACETVSGADSGWGMLKSWYR